MAWEDWFNLGAQAVDWGQKRWNLSDAKSSIKEGYDQARTDVQQAQQPYQEFGKTSLQNYQNMGDFSFSNEDFYRDPSYQWRLDQGLQGVTRQQAANKMLGSGNTLIGLNDYAQNAAAQEYQAAYDRALTTRQENRATNQFGIETGLKSATNVGDNLASLALGRGKDMASIYGAQAKVNSDALSQAAGYVSQQGGQGKVVGDAIQYAMKEMGMDSNAAIEWASGKLGMAKDAVMGVLGLGGTATSAGTMFGTSTGLTSGITAIQSAGTNGLGAMALNPENFGGAFSAGLGESTTATGASLATSGFGTWAASVAGGLGVLMGIKTLNEMLGSDPRIGKTFQTIANSQDPLKTISTLDPKDFTGMLARDGMIGEPGFGITPTQKRGYLYGTVIGAMPPESIDSLRMRDDVDSMVWSMTSALTAGLNQRDKYTDGMLGYPADGLKKMMPDLANEIQALQSLSIRNRSAHDYNKDYAGDFNGMTRTPRDTYDDEIAAKNAALRAKIAARLQEWSNQRTAATMNPYQY